MSPSRDHGRRWPHSVSWTTIAPWSHLSSRPGHSHEESLSATGSGERSSHFRVWVGLQHGSFVPSHRRPLAFALPEAVGGLPIKVPTVEIRPVAAVSGQALPLCGDACTPAPSRDPRKNDAEKEGAVVAGHSCCHYWTIPRRIFPCRSGRRVVHSEKPPKLALPTASRPTVRQERVDGR